MHSSSDALSTTAALLLGVLPLVVAHDEVANMDMDMGAASAVTMSNTTSAETVPTYFRHPHMAGWMCAHLILMLVAWCITLPTAIFLSIARSRYHLPAQVVFHIVNGVGVLAGFVYSHSTPNLYPHESHGPVGWIATSFTIAWTLMSVLTALSGSKSEKRRVPSAQSETSFSVFQHYRDEFSGRSSRDSGHGTERNSASLMGSRQGSESSIRFKPVQLDQDASIEDEEESEKHGLLGDNQVNRFVVRNVQRFASPRITKVVRFIQIVSEKLLLLLGFVAISTGFVIYGGIFMDRQIFSGLAHFIKGAIFFWYGLLTLGRWMGAFSEFGWAWNLRPNYPTVSRWKTRIPSAEFVESFVIWLYGASNVFLEHLNAWGAEWTAQDLEHVSITLLFFGGGLLGMIIESPLARNLMNTTVELQKEVEEEEERGEVGTSPHSHHASAQEGPTSPSEHVWTSPATANTIPLNPLPGLVIMLLGIMMSSHHQTSMVSTMLHASWGKLFCGFALARGITYITLYIRPPTSHFPARPPSELIAAFCLTAGGIMFMCSARDVVSAIEGNGVDAMAVFTVVMGLAGLVMAWVVLLYALKGWAVRRERSGVRR